MKEEERFIKLKDAREDKDKIENILKDFKAQAANNIANKVTRQCQAKCASCFVKLNFYTFAL